MGLFKLSLALLRVCWGPLRPAAAVTECREERALHAPAHRRACAQARQRTSCLPRWAHATARTNKHSCQAARPAPHLNMPSCSASPPAARMASHSRAVNCCSNERKKSSSGSGGWPGRRGRAERGAATSQPQIQTGSAASTTYSPCAGRERPGGGQQQLEGSRVSVLRCCAGKRQLGALPSGSSSCKQAGRCPASSVACR